jgi:hypothetical protein
MDVDSCIDDYHSRCTRTGEGVGCSKLRRK